MKKMIAVVLSVLLFMCVLHAEDTGTYQIKKYTVHLTPHSDGLTTITYYQKWEVTGGHIPWITIGTPNSSFEIVESGLSVASIASANDGSWSGVRIDLNKDYQQGETFEISFTIKQNKLFYADDSTYRLEFTPGWYDNAFTDELIMTMKFFAPMDSVKADPTPSVTSGEEMIWKKTELGKGEQVSISVSFPKSAFPQGIAEENLEEGMGIGMIILILILVIILFLIVVFLASGGDGYSGGGIFYGGSGGSGGGLSSGGGGGFGGRSSSCACACVSCACACACAGGGGAGCDRKKNHSCPVCSQKGGKNEKTV